MLLTGAGLLARSVAGLEAVKPGLDPTNVLTFHVSIPSARYAKPAQALQFFDRALGELRRLPGVERASAINFLPFNGMSSATHVDIGGRPPAKPGEEIGSVIRTVMPGYFRTMGIPLVSGRVFTDADNVESTPYRFVVNQAFAAQYLAGERVLGTQISAHMQSPNPFGEIVGVTGDVREGSVDQEPQPTIYYVQAHMPSTSMVFVLRTAGPPLALAEPARRVIHGLGRATGGGRRPHHGRDRARDLRAPALQRFPAGRILSGGAAAGGHRHLRRAGILGDAADARVRRAGGARRRARHNRRAGAGAGRARGSGGNGGRTGGGDGTRRSPAIHVRSASANTIWRRWRACRWCSAQWRCWRPDCRRAARRACPRWTRFAPNRRAGPRQLQPA